MNHLYYIEHHPHLTKAGLHSKGFYTAEESMNLLASGRHIYRLTRVTATCKGKEVEIRRRSAHPRVRFGKHGGEVEPVE